MQPETAGKLKYGGWGLVCGAIIAIIIGFAWGGWSTSGTTQKISDEAVLATQAAICVAQFMKQPNHEEKLKELGELESWKRAEYIEKGGWDRMPGQKEKPDYTVSRACAAGLELLMKK
jgi:predicted negative regulator of RcsB-dependent stress response